MKLESPHLTKNQFTLTVFSVLMIFVFGMVVEIWAGPRRAKEDDILPVLFKAIMAKVLWEKEFAHKLERRSRLQIL